MFLDVHVRRKIEQLRKDLPKVEVTGDWKKVVSWAEVQAKPYLKVWFSGELESLYTQFERMLALPAQPLPKSALKPVSVFDIAPEGGKLMDPNEALREKERRIAAKQKRPPIPLATMQAQRENIHKYLDTMMGFCAPEEPQPLKPAVAPGPDIIIPEDAWPPDFTPEDQEWFPAEEPQTEPFHEKDLPTLLPIPLLLVTANTNELDAVLHRMLPPAGHDNLLLCGAGSNVYHFGRFGLSNAAVFQAAQKGTGGEGGSQASTGEAISLLNPSTVIAVGIAWGARPDHPKPEDRQKIGDVLVSSSIQPIDPKKQTEEGTEFRGKEQEAWARILSRFVNVRWTFRPLKAAPGFTPRVHIGQVLTGETLVNSTRHRAELLKTFKNAIGGEMEGSGIHAAASRQERRDWLVVKAISDWGIRKDLGNDGNPADYQPLVSAIAVDLVHTVCSKAYLPDPPGDPRGKRPAAEAPTAASSFRIDGASLKVTSRDPRIIDTDANVSGWGCEGLLFGEAAASLTIAPNNCKVEVLFHGMDWIPFPRHRLSFSNHRFGGAGGGESKKNKEWRLDHEGVQWFHVAATSGSITASSWREPARIRFAHKGVSAEIELPPLSLDGEVQPGHWQSSSWNDLPRP